MIWLVCCLKFACLFTVLGCGCCIVCFVVYIYNSGVACVILFLCLFVFVLV